ncbi:MAG: hypothetical protein KIT84_20150 [Labilithrix sp.]|nr:hypothetical protein [Labilithrix sp.]MCW5813352.1 hypothetical protein [Labilithrix sp.]
MVPERSDGDVVAVYDSLLTQALREIRSPATTPGQRIAWARVAEHALEHLPETEQRLAETLSTARKVLDSPEAVQRLIRGVWSCGGCRSADGTWKRLVDWVVNLADRALRGEHWATFAWLAHVAVRLDGVEPTLSPEWERGVRAAHEMPNAHVPLHLIAFHCARRLEQESAPLPDWLRLLRSDERLANAYSTDCSLEYEIQCAVCKRVDP